MTKRMKILLCIQGDHFKASAISHFIFTCYRTAGLFQCHVRTNTTPLVIHNLDCTISPLFTMHDIYHHGNGNVDLQQHRVELTHCTSSIWKHSRQLIIKNMCHAMCPKCHIQNVSISLFGIHRST